MPELMKTFLNMKILLIISCSDNGPLARISLTNVAGALLSLDAINRKSSHIVTGLVLTCLCSTIFTLERNRKEFITAGRSAMTPIISEFPAINIPAYIDPNSNVCQNLQKYFAWKFMIMIYCNTAKE